MANVLQVEGPMIIQTTGGPVEANGAPQDNGDIHENWDSSVRSSYFLADMVEDHCIKTGEVFDRLLFISRGGLFPGNILSRALGFRSIDCFNASVSTYEDKGQTGLLEVGQFPTREEIEGYSWLVEDEVAETLVTLDYVTQRLQKNGALLVRSAVTFAKPVNYNEVIAQSGFKPDIIAHPVGPEWIHFPWEKADDKGRLSIVRQRPYGPFLDTGAQAA